MTKKTVEFLFEVGMLKKTPRTGYQFLGTGGESVAEHSFRTAVIGYALATQVPAADRNKVVLMCLFHDFPEARTGDHNYMNKKYVEVEEDRALEDMVRGLSFGEEVKKIIKEFNSCDTIEAKLSKDADQIDLVMELKQQLDTGNPNAKDWISFAVKRLITEPGKKVTQEILNTHSTDWWFDKNTDWWVNGTGNRNNSD